MSLNKSKYTVLRIRAFECIYYKYLFSPKMILRKHVLIFTQNMYIPTIPRIVKMYHKHQPATIDRVFSHSMTEAKILFYRDGDYTTLFLTSVVTWKIDPLF